MGDRCRCSTEEYSSKLCGARCGPDGLCSFCRSHCAVVHGAEATRINELDLRLVTQAIDELRLVEKRMEDAYFEGTLTLQNRNGYAIGTIATDGEDWVFDPGQYGVSDLGGES